jgi:capsule biosynthesis CapC-like protein
VLALFPPGFESTLLVPVLVGALVMAAFTEWWGWDFVGVVVPGYLCSVLVLEPVAAGVVVLEAVVTVGAVRALVAILDRSRLAYPVFGRDRFYLVLVASVLVRIVVEGLLLQPLAVLLERALPGFGAHRNELFGIGLVLVPLMANRFWRPGLRSGLFQLVVETALVLAAVSALGRFTNFSIAGFELAYDHLALAFLSSPRAQIAILVTAALASAFNKRYGWDYHGILVPALLALAAATPLKLLTTFVEAVVVVGLARALVRLPVFRDVSVEGPRKIVLCFVIGFALKLCLAATLSARYPGYRPADFFGFGYILPSLLAERIWMKMSGPLVVLPTLQTSLLGVATAAALGFVLARIAPVEAGDAGPGERERYATLAQAVAAYGPSLRRGETDDVARLVALARREPPAVESADGYRIGVAEGVRGLVALRSGAARILISGPEEGAAEGAASEASRLGASLAVGLGPPDGAAGAAAAAAARLLGGAPERVDARWSAAPVAALTVLRTRVLEALALSRAAAAPPVPPRALAEAAHRIELHRADPARLARALSPLGLSVEQGEGRLMLSGAGWPVVILGEGRAVVAASHADEIDTPIAALSMAVALGADGVLATDDGGSAGLLAAGMAEAPPRPLLLVRGTDPVPGGDALLLEEPVSGAGRALWLEPVLGALSDRFVLSRDTGPDAAALRAFPPRAGRAGPAALLWLSPRARSAFAGSDAAALLAPDLIALAAERGLSAVRGDPASWIAAGRGAPDEEALAMAERLARTRDVALLRPRAGAARMELFLDERRGLAGFAVEAGRRRALALAGDRREVRARTGTAADAEAALFAGARTLVSRERP